MNRALKYSKLIIWRQKFIDQEEAAGAKLFMGIPERWYEGWDQNKRTNPVFRCLNNHIFTHYLRSEHDGGVCLICNEWFILTFPEDTRDALV